MVNTAKAGTEPLYINRITRWADTSWAQKHHEALIDHVGAFTNPEQTRSLVKALSRCSYETLTAPALSIVNEHLDADDPLGIAAFVRDSVTLAAPGTAYAAKLLMTTTERYVTWCVGEMGLPLDAHVIWSVRAIDLYSTTANQQLSEGSRRNYRGQLMRISEVLLPHEHPERPTALSKRSTSAPYSPRELEQFREWATGQLTPAKVDRAMVMLVLCAGAGVRPNEIALIHPEHIHVDDDGIFITIPTDEPREVPLLAEWEDWMKALLKRRPADESLWGKVNRRTTANLTSSFTENSFGNPPRADRLRHTWMLRHLDAGVPMKDFCRAAGITKLHHIHLLLEFSELQEENDYRRTFRSEGQA
jgi:integrase